MDWQVELLILIVILLVLLLSGMWIAFAIGITGVIALYFAGGTRFFGDLSIVHFNNINTFVLVAVPLFLCMGEIILRSGLSARFYRGVTTWVYRIPGGLFHSNIAACAMFAAVCGASVATAAAIGTVAIPELRERKYDFKLTFGSLAAGGTLGILIPPSIPLIIYGAWTEQSVAELFMAGMVPGVVLALIFMMYIAARVKLQPHLVPLEPGVRYSWRDRLLSLRDIFPVGVLMFLILGGIYLGWTTPTEAAALGLFGALAFAIAYRQLTLKIVRDSLFRAVRTMCMAMLILLGSQVFSFGLVTTGISRNLVAWIVSFHLHPMMFLGLITLLLLLMGCFIESLAMMLLTLPILYPVVLEMGFDPVWFGVFMVIEMELGLITPPVGLNLFVIHGISEGRPLSEVVIGAFPFVFLMLLMILILAVWPGLALWLPGQMR